MLRDETVFISGGAGFIGTALTKYFLNTENKVIIYDSLSRNSIKLFPEIHSHPSLELIKGDIRDQELLKEAIKNSTIIFHLAAIAGVSKYFKIPVQVMEVNILGTYNILQAVKENKNIKALFDFSTSEIYGSDCFGALEDGDIKMEKIFSKRWTYATSKIASEKIGLSFYWQYEVPFIAIRPFNIYGPGQIGEGVISYFLTNALNNEAIKITGDGTQSRTFCYIDDFISGIAVILDNLPEAIGNSFNIGRSDEIISIKSLAMLVKKLTNSHSEISFIDHAGDDVMVRSPNINKVKKLGYNPKVDLEMGVRLTAEWYKRNQVVLD
jgi:nucleoside-diphosphate-sugar epimerase